MEEKLKIHDNGAAVGPTKKPSTYSKKNEHGVESSSSRSSALRQGDTLVTPSGYSIEKEEMIRVMIQSLKDMGCTRSADVLEEESGITLELPCVKSFRNGVVSGDWKLVRDLLPKMKLSPPNIIEANLMICEEEFLELLDQGKLTQAVKTLQSSIAPCHPSARKVNELSSLIMYSNPSDLRKAAEWKGVQGGSRIELMSKLNKLMDPAFVVPVSRMLSLADHAISHQISQCQFHNNGLTHFSILHDHRCSLGEIPKACVAVLEHDDEVWDVKFSHDGSRIASASKDRSIIVWDMKAEIPKQLHKLLGHRQAPSFLSWSPDDSLLLSSDHKSSFRVWDMKNAKCILAIPEEEKDDVTEPDSILACAWHPDGKHIVAGTLLEKKIVTWDLDGKKVEWDIKLQIRDLQVSDAGRMVVVDTQHTLRSFDLATKKRTKFNEKNEKHTSPITSLSLSRDGRYVLVSISDPAGVLLWDLATGKRVRRYEGMKQSRYVVQASFGGAEDMFIVSGSEDSQVYVWHRLSGNLLSVLPGHSGTVNSVDWSPIDPHMLVSASDDGTIRVWGRKKR